MVLMLHQGLFQAKRKDLLNNTRDLEVFGKVIKIAIDKEVLF